jgi:hypothetical protein
MIAVSPRPEEPTMPEEPHRGLPPEVQDELNEITELLRSADHLGPDAQAALAALADDLGRTADPQAPAESARLLKEATNVVRLLHRQERSALTAARDGLEEAAVKVENRAPQTAQFARRLLDVLADLGI